MADFNIAFDNTMAAEGGYANNPNDNGGETYKGIARKFWPKWLGWSIIDTIKRNYSITPSVINSHAAGNAQLQKFVREFYKLNFWDVNKLDQVKYQSIAKELFDTGVNQGTGLAAKYLQEALNLCNKNQRSYSDIVVDGKIGPVTISILNNKAHELAVLNTLNMLQGEKYLAIMRANKTQEEFWPSWLSRVIITGKW